MKAMGMVRMVAAAVRAAGALVGQAAPVSGQGTWETTLKTRDISGNAVARNDSSAAFFHDTALNLTWLADWNVNGPMDWSTAVSWADNLTIGGFNDWRLPTVSPVSGNTFQYVLSNSGSTDVGHAKTDVSRGLASDDDHVYYVRLGNVGFCTPNDASPTSCASQSGWGLSSTGPFSNMSSTYWTSTPVRAIAVRRSVKLREPLTQAVGPGDAPA